MNDMDFYDPARVEEMIDRLYQDAALTKAASNGATVRDEDKMRAKVFDLVKSKVVADKTQKSANSWTQGELYAAVFPGAPGTDGRGIDSLGANELKVRIELMRRVWTLTNPARNGYIQKRLGDGEGTLVLCRVPVMRGLDEAPGCYVTNDGDLIMSDSLQPRVEALVRAANNLRDHAGMLTDRHGELENRILAAVGSGAARTTAALPSPRGNGATRKAIPAASEPPAAE
jgi:hypothetical protein